MKRILINAIGFNVGWFACVLSSRFGIPLAAALFVGLLLLVHLFITTPAQERRRELIAVAVVAIIGIVVDSGNLIGGVLSFEGSNGLSPVFLVWIASFWLNFALTLSVALRWLGRMPIVAAILGAVSAPGTYYFGARLSELELATPLRYSFSVLAVEWAVLLPVFFVISRGIRPVVTAPEGAPA